jgi:ABC-type lipopolysaccharide export system ATPase subunit
VILAIALFLAVLFGAVGTITGHRIALHQTARDQRAATRAITQACDLAYTILKSPAASIDPEAVQQAKEILANQRKDLTN